MMFSPYQIAIIYSDSTAEAIAIEKNKTEFSGQNVKIKFDIADDGAVTPKLYALNDIKLSLVQIMFRMPEEALGEDLYYYYAAFTTNDITSVFKHSERPRNNMKDVFVAKNTKTGVNMNIGLLTAHRFYTCIPFATSLFSRSY